jgi:hypothetical protein
MMMEPRQISTEYNRDHHNFSSRHKKIYIERDDSNKDYSELISKNTNDFEKTYYANLL